MIRKLLGTAGGVLAICEPALGQPVEQRLDTIFANYTHPESPGCAIAIGGEGRTEVRRAWGSADLEHGVPITPATIFEAGSVSKQFTAAAILLLAQDGRLSLADDVRRYIPELPDYGSPITIEHLLSHLGGLRDWGSVAELGGWRRGTQIRTNADALAIIARQRSLNFAPGTEFSYTNSGYVLLAAIVPRVSGLTLAEYTKQRIFEPLGMRSTSWRDDFRRVVPNRAIAYRRGRDGWEQDMPFENAYGHGGLLTTVGDLLLWNEALSERKLGGFLSEALTRRGTRNDGGMVTYARGVYVDRYRNAEEISHGGSTAGYRAFLARWPDRRLSMALLCNAANLNPEVVRDIADAVEFGPAPPPAADADGSRFAGFWLNESTGFPSRIEWSSGQLSVNGGAAWAPASDNSFEDASGNLTIVSEGSLRFTSREGQEALYRRISPWSPTPAELPGFTGTYASDEAQAAYDIVIEDGSLSLRHTSRPGSVVALEPSYRDSFLGGGMLLRFRRGNDGRVEALSMSSGRIRDLRFYRVPLPPVR